MKPLSDRQQKIYDFIVDCINERGLPPTVREICAHVGLSSPSTAQMHLNNLEKLGLITRDSSKNRSIRLTAKSRKGVPLLGTVTAGVPILAVEQLEDYVPYETPDDGDYFALRVRGDSMINAGIFDGDTVVVRQQSSASSGDIVVGMLEDEATVKRFRIIEGHPWLMPENESYSPIDGQNAVILGRVKTVIREL